MFSAIFFAAGAQPMIMFSVAGRSRPVITIV